jgi:hypothetical protein
MCREHRPGYRLSEQQDDAAANGKQEKGIDQTETERRELESC